MLVVRRSFIPTNDKNGEQFMYPRFFSMEFLRTLEQIRTPLWDTIFYYFTYGGEEITLLVTLCILFWCVSKKAAYRLMFSFFSSALVIHFLKLSFRIPRPWVRDPEFTIVERARGSATGYSFPSGHTQTSTSLFGTLAFTKKKTWIALVSFLAIFLVMFSRMYLGVHTPADVGCAFVLSIIVVFFINYLFDHVELTDRKRLLVMISFALLTICTCGYFISLYRNGLIPYKDLSDCCKGCAAAFGFIICWYIETTRIHFEPNKATLPMQIIKVIIGFAGALLIKEGLKVLLGSNVCADIFRYICIMLWTMLAMPLIIRRFLTLKEEDPQVLGSKGR